MFPSVSFPVFEQESASVNWSLRVFLLYIYAFIKENKFLYRYQKGLGSQNYLKPQIADFFSNTLIIGGFFLACENLGKMFDHPFPACDFVVVVVVVVVFQVVSPDVILWLTGLKAPTN